MKNYKRNKGGAEIRGTGGAAGAAGAEGAAKKAKEGAVIKNLTIIE